MWSRWVFWTPPLSYCIFTRSMVISDLFSFFHIPPHESGVYKYNFIHLRTNIGVEFSETLWGIGWTMVINWYLWNIILAGPDRKGNHFLSSTFKDYKLKLPHEGNWVAPRRKWRDKKLHLGIRIRMLFIYTQQTDKPNLISWIMGILNLLFFTINCNPNFAKGCF